MVESQSTASHRNGNRVKTHCKYGHLFDEVNTYISKTGGRHCRACHRKREFDKVQTPEGKAKNLARVRAYAKNHKEHYNQYCRNRRAETNEWLRNYKQSGCVKCGETFPDCLDFHHRDPIQKKFAIGTRAGAIALKTLQAEAAKCDLLCANCHRKLHAAERLDK